MRKNLVIILSFGYCGGWLPTFPYNVLKEVAREGHPTGHLWVNVLLHPRFNEVRGVVQVQSKAAEPFYLFVWGICYQYFPYYRIGFPVYIDCMELIISEMIRNSAGLLAREETEPLGCVPQTLWIESTFHILMDYFRAGLHFHD